MDAASLTTEHMLVIRHADCPEFQAGDHTRLRELLHPDKSGATVRYSLAYGYLDPGRRSLVHRLRSSEVYYVLSGQGLFTIGQRSVVVSRGDVVYVPPGEQQTVFNDGSERFEFLCLVDPAWRPEDEAVLETLPQAKE